MRNIRLPVDADDSDALYEARKILGVPSNCDAFIYKKGVDARREKVYFVYSVIVKYPYDKEKIKQINSPDVSCYEPLELEIKHGNGRLSRRPVICGFGPAGMFAGLILSKMGYRPVIIERGGSADERALKVKSFWHGGSLDPECNVQFGEGGAGTFSDGKLTTRINDPYCATVLKELLSHGAPGDIMHLAKPHIGTDRLIGVVKSIREDIIKLGADIIFNDTVIDIEIKDGKIKSVMTKKKGKIETEVLIIAVGHSARDTYDMLLSHDIVMQQKPFSIGVRAEHLQSEINRAMYGRFSGHKNLRPGEYQLSHREGERGVYSFCMCPGGTVIGAASEMGGIVVNGMSNYQRDGTNANSAIAVSVLTSDFESSDPLAGVEFQRRYERLAYKTAGENYSAPVQLLSDFLNDRKSVSFGRVKPTYTGETAFCDLNECLPDFAVSMIKKGFTDFERKIRGFSAPDTVLTGVETRTSSPVRITRESDHTACGFSGIYPCGEGAGYSGGIMSSAVDGIRTAVKIIEKYSLPKE